MYQKPLNSGNNQPGIFCRLLAYYFNIINEFLRITVTNGLKYFTFKYLTVLERLLFVCCFCTAAYNSISFAMHIAEKWKISPVITVMNHQSSFIKREPFPAITICNMNQAQYTKVKDFDVKSLDYAMLQKLCFQEINYTSFSSNQPRHKNDSFANFIIKNTQSCSHMVAACKYGHSYIACSDLFREVLLDEGMCCVFNTVHPYLMYKGNFLLVHDYTSVNGPSIPLEWNPDKGYPKELPTSFYPRAPFGSGVGNGFNIILNGDYDNYYCSSTNGPGFKVSLHNPIDTPNIKETGLSVALGFQTSLRVTPTREESSAKLRTSTSFRERQCYFSDEYILKYFRLYTQRNCEMECNAEFMLHKCNCILYYMPLLSENVTFCHVRHFDCVVEVEKDFSDQSRITCYKKCLPNCNDLVYFPNAFFTTLDNEGFGIRYAYLRNFSKADLKKYAVLKIYLPENYYKGSIKNQYMGLTEFLSQVGGLMSLLMGFSVISLVEIVYFFFIKPLMYFWRKFGFGAALDTIGMNSSRSNVIQLQPSFASDWNRIASLTTDEQPRHPRRHRNNYTEWYNKRF